MSTFKGIIAEFPQIRIDYFRPLPGHSPPLACFLSHVHSDHLTGLESQRAPFVYCSAATREILLRLEKYHYRVNFARGILESRNVTYDRSMRRLAKPLPLNTPIVIELAPGNSIRVTLLDANHCIGSVMFLIEGHSKAILYTGDVRAEPWWVNSLVQNPVLLPYTLGTSRLQCIYLDTTFATKDSPYGEFQSKADGIRELLQKVGEYPDDTVFYFHSWTFGYENVWIALSTFLRSQIHLDQYRAGIYASLSSLEKKHLREAGLDIYTDNKFLQAPTSLHILEAPALCGFRNGNHTQPGCLTSQENVRIHSCERGMGCAVMDRDANARVVHVVPIVSRSSTGLEIAEVGAGGGKGDLNQKEDLETGNSSDVERLAELCRKSIDDEELLARVLDLLSQVIGQGQGDDNELDLDLSAALQRESQDSEDEPSLQTLISALISHATKNPSIANPNPHPPNSNTSNRTIRFPYSRHSSYSELCGLVNVFQPRDVYPCTVDEENWIPTMGMRGLFGEYCSGDIFRHDAEMLATARGQEEWRKHGWNGSGNEQCSQRSEEELDKNDWGRADIEIKRARLDSQTDGGLEEAMSKTCAAEPAEGRANNKGKSTKQTEQQHCRQENRQERHQCLLSPVAGDEVTNTEPITTSSCPAPQGPHTLHSKITLPSTPAQLPSGPTTGAPSHPSTTSNPDPSGMTKFTTSCVTTTPSALAPNEASKKRKRISHRRIAYEAALGTQLTWAEYGGLVSTRRKEDVEELEL